MELREWKKLLNHYKFMHDMMFSFFSQYLGVDAKKDNYRWILCGKKRKLRITIAMKTKHAAWETSKSTEVESAC
jgi:hypothetical protein